MALRHKAYFWLKIAKTNIPRVRQVRLLKTAEPTDHYGTRPILDEAEGNRILLERLAAGGAFAAGKIGDCELEALLKYEATNGDPGAFFRSIRDQGHELDLLYVNCGVFPKRADTVARWARTYLTALGQMDLLGVWYNAGEEDIVERYAPAARLTGLRAIEPYYHDRPWTSSLEGKRVAVVTPFGDSITAQRNRYRSSDLFSGRPDVLPDFELSVVRAPFSAALRAPEHRDWHETLNVMETALAGREFDVCLVGAGAYSLPICAFVRTELRRPAVHLGGATQILFGVKGKRWEGHPAISRFFNENWIRPLPHERPKHVWKLEGGAYW
jgi:hypothetical protein